ncbi:heme peroxidase [Aureobasidium subglaciale]|nr:heme peroxidase [Aureobasidium subglaciale]
MHLSLVAPLLTFVTLNLNAHVRAWPAMAQTGAALARRLPQAADPNVDNDIVRVGLGDVKNGGTTPVGTSVYNILMGTEPGDSAVAGYKPPGIVGTKACKADTCCVWWWISQAMTLAFTGPTGRCNSFARAAIRLGFHDAGAWSSSLAANGQDFGGADGSIILSGTEINRGDNNGLQAIANQALLWSKVFNVGVADIIQFAAVHAVVTCPLGPRTRAFVGRKDSKQAAPENLMPSVSMSADEIISLFEDKTIQPHDLAALLGAHSTSQQFVTDKTKAGFGQDSTPGVWDVNFYNETLQPGTNSKVFKFQSDLVTANDSRVSDEWHAFIGDQNHWNGDYASAYVRLSMLGVNNINNLTECTKVLPAEKKTFAGASTPGLFGKS